MKSNASTSPQYLRTDRAIMQTFIDLLDEKPFEKITIQDILDRTPVTRATFYAHYHDKYEIAEQMQEKFFQLRDEFREQIKKDPSQAHFRKCRKNFHTANRNLISALLKIHTDRVDLHKMLVDEFVDFYFERYNKNASITEARIYAYAYAEIYLTFDYENNELLSFDEINHSIINAFLSLLRLHDDGDVLELLHRKIKNKYQ